MATVPSTSAIPFTPTPSAVKSRPVPPLANGDRLTRVEFERRYRTMPQVKKAELIEGMVYMPSPVSSEHGSPHMMVTTWLGVYWASTAGVRCSDNETIRLDLDNEVQPDAMLLILPARGGQSQIGQDGYVEGAPEFIAEIAASSASYDLHAKLNAYRRNAVREYLVWRVYDQAIDWFVLREGEYERLPANAAGILQSQIFPGLWLDAAALLRNDLAAVLQLVQQGIASREHAQFVQRLSDAGKKITP